MEKVQETYDKVMGKVIAWEQEYPDDEKLQSIIARIERVKRELDDTTRGGT